VRDTLNILTYKVVLYGGSETTLAGRGKRHLRGCVGGNSDCSGAAGACRRTAGRPRSRSHTEELRLCGKKTCRKSLAYTFPALLWLSSRLAPVSKPGRTGAVYRDSVNMALRIFPVYPGPPATNYRASPGYTQEVSQTGIHVVWNRLNTCSRVCSNLVLNCSFDYSLPFRIRCKGAVFSKGQQVML